jgi:hypothetical protein
VVSLGHHKSEEGCPMMLREKIFSRFALVFFADARQKIESAA